MFSSPKTTTTTFQLFSLLHHHHHHHHHHISIVFLSTTTTTTIFLLFSFLLLLLISTVFPPTPPHSVVFYPPPPPSRSIVFYPSPTRFIFFFSARFYKRLPTAIFSSFWSNVSCGEQQSWFFFSCKLHVKQKKKKRLAHTRYSKFKKVDVKLIFGGITIDFEVLLFVQRDKQKTSV